MRFTLPIAALALTLAAAQANAQDPAAMQEAVEEKAAEQSYMGAALVAHGDAVLLDEAYGSADLEWNIANTTDTKFRIGSVTKQFTAASILLLAQRGELDIDAPVSTYLADAPQAWNAVTVRHVLHHTSGIPNITDFDDFGLWKYAPTRLSTTIERIAERPLDFAPGEKWSYSNSGYIVLAAVVDEVSGMPLADFMRANIFEPLGMEDTGVDRAAVILPRRASGYTPSQSGIVNADHIDMTIPAGGGDIYSTTHDLLKWQRGLFGGQLVDPQHLGAMTAPGVDAFPGSTYAMGLIRTDNEQGTLIWHGGGIEGFNAFLGYDPDRKISVVVLANLNGGAANQLGQALVAMARSEDGNVDGEEE